MTSAYVTSGVPCLRLVSWMSSTRVRRWCHQSSLLRLCCTSLFVDAACIFVHVLHGGSATPWSSLFSPFLKKPKEEGGSSRGVPYICW